MAWGSHSEKEMIIGKVIFEISRKNDVHNNYETDYSSDFDLSKEMLPLFYCYDHTLLLKDKYLLLYSW